MIISRSFYTKIILYLACIDNYKKLIQIVLGGSTSPVSTGRGGWGKVDHRGKVEHALFRLGS